MITYCSMTTVGMSKYGLCLVYTSIIQYVYVSKIHGFKMIKDSLVAPKKTTTKKNTYLPKSLPVAKKHIYYFLKTFH